METEEKPNLNIEPLKFDTRFEGVNPIRRKRWEAFEADKELHGICNADLHPDIVAIRTGLSSFVIIFGGMVCFLLMCFIPFLPIEYIYLEILPIIVLVAMFYNKEIIKEELNK